MFFGCMYVNTNVFIQYNINVTRALDWCYEYLFSKIYCTTKKVYYFPFYTTHPIMSIYVHIRLWCLYQWIKGKKWINQMN